MIFYIVSAIIFLFLSVIWGTKCYPDIFLKMVFIFMTLWCVYEIAMMRLTGLVLANGMKIL